MNRVTKIKIVAGRRWHREENCWTVPYTEGAVARLLALFAGGPVEVESSLRPAGAPGVQNPPHDPETLHATGGDLSKEMARVREAIRARHYSHSTEEAYVVWGIATPPRWASPKSTTF